jgi:RimJ/RimL family protein N-acetyltransferase
MTDLRLRDVIESDLPIFFEQLLDADANYMAAFTLKNPADREAFDAHWARIRGDPKILINTILVDTDVVGHVLSFEQDGQREVSYWVDKKLWGRGIATKALREFLHHDTRRPLNARAAKDNIASIRVLEKCGFVKQGEDKWFANARGAEIDECIFRLDGAT